MNPSGDRLRIIVTGLVGQYPVGGVAWDYLQYVLGFSALGHDAYYFEDTWSWPYDPAANSITESPDYSVAFLDAFFRNHAPHLADKWHYRHLHEFSHGMSASAAAAVIKSADLFLNVSGANICPDDLPSSCRTVFLDTDPGYNQAVLTERFAWSENVERWCEAAYAHNTFCTYAENIAEPDCEIPETGLSWITTRMPIDLDSWRFDGKPESDGPWSTVMTWNAFKGPVIVNGREFGSKDMEFPLIESLPNRIDLPLQIAIGGIDPPRDRLTQAGWHIESAPKVSLTPDSYRRWIADSRGEISVAKNIYVAMRTGWFSCRSACYLAAGRPVITQETGFSDHIPTGEGLFSFSTLDEAVAAIEAVESDYERHCKAAREIAEEYFDSRKVLTKLLDDVMS